MGPYTNKAKARKKRARTGKVSSLNPVEQMKKNAAVKKAADAKNVKKPAAKPKSKAKAKPKTEAKTKAKAKVKVSDVAKKVVTSGVGKTVARIAARVLPGIAAAFATRSAINTMTGPGGPWHNPGGSNKQKPFTINPVDIYPSGISLDPDRSVPYKRPKEAVDTAPNPDPRNVYKKPEGPLGRQPLPGKSLKALGILFKGKSRGAPPSPSSVDKDARKDYDDWNYVKKAVTQSTPTTVKVDSASTSKPKVSKIAAKTTDRSQPASKRDKPEYKKQVKVTVADRKSPVAKARVTKEFDTSMGVYGWNNLTNSFGYLGTEKEVGKHGSSTYFTEGYKRGSKKKKKPTTIVV